MCFKLKATRVVRAQSLRTVKEGLSLSFPAKHQVGFLDDEAIGEQVLSGGNQQRAGDTPGKGVDGSLQNLGGVGNASSNRVRFRVT